MPQKRLLVIDNYDSFTFNLVQLFMHFDLKVKVKRNDQTSLTKISAFCPDYILISPGPKWPAKAGLSLQLIEHFHTRIPILGVCLGMQCLNEFFGGQTQRAPLPVHGKTSMVRHNSKGIFAGLPSPFVAARYHSLQCIPDRTSPLQITAQSEDGVIMGLSHPRLPVHGVQFHPESFLSEYGLKLGRNFLACSPAYPEKSVRSAPEHDQSLAYHDPA